MPIIVLRLEAEADLRSIDSFSRERYGNAVTDEYMAEIDAAFERLADYPELGRPVKSGKVPLRVTKAGRHRIFYYFDGQRIVIVRLLHDAMDARRHILI